MQIPLEFLSANATSRKLDSLTSSWPNTITYPIAVLLIERFISFTERNVIETLNPFYTKLSMIGMGERDRQSAELTCDHVHFVDTPQLIWLTLSFLGPCLIS